MAAALFGRMPPSASKTPGASDRSVGVGPSKAQPWVEKYRPRTLDDVEAQKEAVTALRACLSAGANMPHMLFHGPAGTGKTSSVLAVAHDLFGPDFIKARVRELNASDDRGIAVVREKVKTFAQGASTAVSGRVQSDGKVYPVPGFKLIVLDEADALLPDAQAALRRMMEDFSEVTRFCILCNYVSKIIDPIASRCAKFRFKALPKESLRNRVALVAEREQLQVSDGTLDHLQLACQGDLRLAITLLQSACRAHGPDLRNEQFVEVSGIIPEAIFAEYINALCGGRFDVMRAATKDLVLQGFAASQVVTQLQWWTVSKACPLSDAARARICLKLAQTERRLFDRGDDELQLLDLGLVVSSLAGQPSSTAPPPPSE